LVALGLIAALVKLVDIREVMSAISQADARNACFVLLIALCDRYLMAYKWNTLLRAQGAGLTHAEAFRIYMASGFIGTFLPTGVGSDIFRVARSTAGGQRLHDAAASILVERALGLLAVTALGLCGVGVLLLNRRDGFESLFYAVTGLFILQVLGIVVSVHPRTYGAVDRLLSPFFKYRIVALYLKCHRACTALGQHRKVLVAFFALSVLEQSLQAAMAFFAATAMHLTAPFIYFLALIPLSNIVATLPISISAIGVQEGMYVALLPLAGMTASEALALALLMRVLGWVILIPSGIFFFMDAVRMPLKRPARLPSEQA
jgi:uncharacterized protein (TIRG00374 family)